MIWKFLEASLQQMNSFPQEKKRKLKKIVIWFFLGWKDSIKMGLYYVNKQNNEVGLFRPKHWISFFKQTFKNTNNEQKNQVLELKFRGKLKTFFSTCNRNNTLFIDCEHTIWYYRNFIEKYEIYSTELTALPFQKNQSIKLHLHHKKTAAETQKFWFHLSGSWTTNLSLP